jgi:hypothetical protein
VAACATPADAALTAKLLPATPGFTSSCRPVIGNDRNGSAANVAVPTGVTVAGISRANSGKGRMGSGNTSNSFAASVSVKTGVTVAVTPRGNSGKCPLIASCRNGLTASDVFNVSVIGAMSRMTTGIGWGGGISNCIAVCRRVSLPAVTKTPSSLPRPSCSLSASTVYAPASNPVKP